MSAAKPGRQFSSLPSTRPAAGLLDELTGTAAPAPPAAAPRPLQAAPPIEAPTAEQPARHAPTPEAPAAGLPGRRVPIRVQVPEELADRVRAAVAHLSWQVESWSSLNAATAAALEQFVKAAEDEHNGGEPFPWTPGRQLPAGRRVGH